MIHRLFIGYSATINYRIKPLEPLVHLRALSNSSPKLGCEEVPRMALRVLRPKSPHSEASAQYIEQNCPKGGGVCHVSALRSHHPSVQTSRLLPRAIFFYYLDFTQVSIASLSISCGVPDNARLRRYGVLDESHSGIPASNL